MSRRIRCMVAAFAASAVLVAGAVPAMAYDEKNLQERDRYTPVLLDAFILRPVGLALTGVGTAVFAVATPLVLLTRPTDIAKPFETLVARPFRYTFFDPLGEH